MGSLLVALLAFPANAITPADVEFLCGETDVAIVGTVDSMASSLVADQDGNETIYTVVELDVDRVVHGSPGNTVTIRIEGGTVGNKRASVSHMPRMAMGDQWAVALNYVQGAQYPIIVQYRYIVPGASLPSESYMQQEWNDACD